MKPLDYLKKIESHGYEAYIVGGYVRDNILNIKSNDIDIITDARPQEVSKIFDVNVSNSIGSVNIKTAEYNIDITTYRVESDYIKHRPKSVEYVNSLLVDLLRRDFTINAICMNSLGDIYDPLNGINDLNNKIIKCIGPVEYKFKMDPLRMLRALRFAICYDLKINDEELAFILSNKKLFDEITYERKRQEFDKILISENSIKGLKWLNDIGILPYLGITYREIKYTHDLIGMWAQLDTTNYPFTKLEKKRIDNIRNILSNNIIDKYTLYNYGLYDTCVAAKIMGLSLKEVNELDADLQIHSESELKINGLDIKDILNIDSSPLIKTIKKDLIENIISGKLTNETSSLREYIIKKWK